MEKEEKDEKSASRTYSRYDTKDKGRNGLQEVRGGNP